jgi:hypothetical protein
VDHNISINDSGGNPTGWRIIPSPHQLAISIAKLALDKYSNGDTVSPNELRAVYVRASDAEIKEKWPREK